MRKPFAFLFGLTIISFIAAIQIFNAIGFFIGISVNSAVILPAALISSAFICWRGSKIYFASNSLHVFIKVMIWASVALVISLALSSLIYDWSWDGQSYHAEGVMLLANGWNPVTQPLPEGEYAQLLSFSSKGPWVTEATIFQATHSIEAAKGVNLAILIATFGVTFAALSNVPKIKPRPAIYLTFLMVLNPVSIVQIFSFYIDVQLACYITILISLILLLEFTEPKSMLNLSLMVISILLINIKLNGAVYLVIFVVGYLGWQLWHRQFKPALNYIRWLAGGFVLGVLIVGYNPYITQYVTQTFQHGNPFYPTQWDGLFLITPNTPANLIGKDRFTKMGISLFSASSDSKLEANPKVPFTVSRRELNAFLSANVRSAGFGPFFSGVLLLCLLTIVIFFIYSRNSFKISLTFFLSAMVVFSSLIVSEGWWARYAPQFWLAPILLTLAITTLRTQRLVQLINYFAIGTLAVNVIMICTVYLAYIYPEQMRYQNDMKVIKTWTEQNGNLPIYSAEFPITQLRLEESNIPYSEIDPDKCPEEYKQRILPSYGWMCVSTILYEQPESTQ